MNPFPGPHSIIVLNNARIQHGPELLWKVLEQGTHCLFWTLARSHQFTGCLIEYLPPYSPNYNPIEQAFSIIKTWLRKRGIYKSLDNASYYKLYQLCQVITREMTWGFFHHSGYL
jgi:transposase